MSIGFKIYLVLEILTIILQGKFELVMDQCQSVERPINFWPLSIF